MKIEFKKNFKKNYVIWIMTAAFIIFITLAFALDVYGMNITPDTCYQFNYTYYDNTTNITTDLNQSFCCEYANITYNQTIIYNDTTNLTLELSPGEILSGTKENCNYVVSCSGCNYTNCSVCYVSKTLQPGQNYSKDDGVCLVDIYCNQTEECIKYLNETYSYTFEISIVKQENGTLLITIFNETIDEDLTKRKAFSTSYDKTIRCPITGTAQDVINFSYEQCNEYMSSLSDRDWLDAFGMYAGYMSASDERYGNLLGNVFNESVNMTMVLSDRRALELENSILQNNTRKLENEIYFIEKERDDYRLSCIFLFIIAIIGVGSAIAMFVRFKRHLFGGPVDTEVE